MEYRISALSGGPRRDGQVELRGVRQRELLAVSCCTERDRLERSPDRRALARRLPPTAAKIVQNKGSQLRRLPESELLVTRSPGYLLRVEPGELDGPVRASRRAGTADLAAGDAAKAAEQLREALALWRGPALADFTDAPFARVESARLEELRLAATEDRIEAELALGRHADLVWSWTLVARHPLRSVSALSSWSPCTGQAARPRPSPYHETREVLVESSARACKALQRLERAVPAHDLPLELAPEERALSLRGKRSLAGDAEDGPVVAADAQPRRPQTWKRSAAR
jgi:hypothetical protein